MNEPILGKNQVLASMEAAGAWHINAGTCSVCQPCVQTLVFEAHDGEFTSEKPRMWRREMWLTYTGQGGIGR